MDAFFIFAAEEFHGKSRLEPKLKPFLGIPIAKSLEDVLLDVADKIEEIVDIVIVDIAVVLFLFLLKTTSPV